MKVVAVDPLCTPAGSKADEWLPIRPGTDGALVLSIINVLLNELGIYDREFIKRYTNGPYLVKPDGYYARREGKPLVWDTEEVTAKTFDAEVLFEHHGGPGKAFPGFGRIQVNGPRRVRHRAGGQGIANLTETPVGGRRHTK